MQQYLDQSDADLWKISRAALHGHYEFLVTTSKANVSPRGPYKFMQQGGFGSTGMYNKILFDGPGKPVACEDQTSNIKAEYGLDWIE